MVIHRTVKIRRKTYRLTICTRTMEWKNTRIAFLGGDLRLIHTASAFAAKGADCVLWGSADCGGSFPCASTPADAIHGADLVVLGIPVSRDSNTLNAPHAKEQLKLSELVKLLSAGQKVAMGMAPVRFRKALDEKGCICYDYNEDECFALANARSTAEGALAIAIREHPDTLLGATCAVVGFGRIAKQLCHLLTAVGAKVTVFARKESDLAHAATLGCEARPIGSLTEASDRFALLFNTVPIRLPDFPSERIQGIVIDLAPVYPDSDHPKLMRAPSLPMLYAPRSSGKLICDCIVRRFAAESEGAQ